MKQFLLFDYDPRDPRGGWADFVKSSDQITELMDDVMDGPYQEIVERDKERIVLSRSFENPIWQGNSNG